MANTHAEIDDREIRAFLKRIGNRINTKALSRISTNFVFRDVMDHFKNEQGPDGAWKKWSDSYIAQLNGEVFFFRRNGRLMVGSPGKKSRHAGGKKLQDTGRLRQSFTTANYRVNQNQIIWFNQAKTKNGFPYAYAHDTGGPKLPQRRFMWLSKSAFNELTNSYLKYIME